MAQVKARTVLWYMSFFGFMVNYMTRINLNITIVEMIAAKGENEKWLSNDTLGNIPATNAKLNNASVSSGPMNNAIFKTHARKFSLERSFLDWAGIDYEPNGFHWDEAQQSKALGSFYWSYWVLQIPGGILAKKYGTKLVFGLGNVIACWSCFLIPIASYLNTDFLIWLRIIQGLATGVNWPAMHVMAAQWIPPTERSKFVTSYLGNSIGIALFYPIFGYIMHWTSWEWVYHICGILGTVWYIGWLYFVYDSPAEHPHIHQSERIYIEKSLGNSVQNTWQGQTPWKSILTSRPVWMNVLAQFGSGWGMLTLMTYAPTYFRLIHNWDLRATGFFSGLPHLMRMLFAYVTSIFSDFLLRTDKMSCTNVRKLSTVSCCIVNGILVLALAFYGYNSTAAIVLIVVATMFHGGISGLVAACVDLSPNFGGIIFGISNLIAVLPGFISPWVVGLLTVGNQTIEAWKNVFLIASAILIGCGIIFVLFGESELQDWNTVKKSDLVLKEMQSTLVVANLEEKQLLNDVYKKIGDDK